MKIKTQNLSPRYQISLSKLLRTNSQRDANQYSFDPSQYNDNHILLGTLDEIESRFEYFTQSDRREWIANQTKIENKPEGKKRDSLLRVASQEKSLASMYIATNQKIKSIEPKENLHILVSVYGEKFLTTLFDGLIIHMVKEIYCYDIKVDQLGTIQKILNSFGVNPLKLAQLSSVEQQKRYIYQQASQTIKQLLQEWQLKLDKRQKQMKLTDEQLCVKCESSQQIDYDVFEWLQLKTKFKSLKKKLRSTLIEKLSEYENQIVILKDKKNHLKLQGIQKVRTSMILKRSDTIIRKLFSSLREQKLIQIDPSPQDIKRKEQEQIERIQSHVWNDDLELKFLKNRQYAKINYFQNIICSNFNQMGFLPLVQELNLANKNKMKRESKMDKCFTIRNNQQTKTENIQQKQSLNSQLIQDTVDNLDQNQINALETNLSEEIIENYETMVNIVHKSRFEYLQQKNIELNKQTSDKVDFYVKEKLQIANRKFLLKEKKKFQSVIRKYQKQGNIQLNTPYTNNFFVKMFAYEVMQRVKSIRKRKIKIENRNELDISVSNTQRESFRAGHTKVRVQKSRQLHPPSKLSYYTYEYDYKEQMEQKVNKYRLEIHSKSPKIKQDFINYYSNGPKPPKQSKPFYNLVSDIQTKCTIQLKQRLSHEKRASKHNMYTKSIQTLLPQKELLQAQRDRLSKKINPLHPQIRMYKVLDQFKNDKTSQNQKPCGVYVPKKRLNIQFDLNRDRYIRNPSKSPYKQKKQVDSLTTQKLKHKKLLHYSRTNNHNMLINGGYLYEPDEVNILDEYNKSPLWYSIENANLLLAKWLLSQGADVDQICQNGQTALHCAFQTQNLQAIYALNEAGGDLNICDDDGYTALAYGSESVLNHLQFKEGVCNRLSSQTNNNKLWFRKTLNLEPQYQQRVAQTIQPLKNVKNSILLTVQNL